MTSSTNDVTSWSLAHSATNAACVSESTRRHPCSMATSCCTSAGTAVRWRPHRCEGKLSLIAKLCKLPPRGTRSCSKAEDDVPLSTTEKAFARISQHTDAPLGRTKVLLRETTLALSKKELFRVLRRLSEGSRADRPEIGSLPWQAPCFFPVA